MSRATLISLVAISALAGCDYTGDFLFAGAIEGMEPIYHIYAEDGSEFLIPVDICPDKDPDDDDPEFGCLTDDDFAGDVTLIPPATIYGEVSPTGTSVEGGITFYFEGNGRDVCIWIDPETAFYSQVIDTNQSGADLQQYSYPNNVFDDGDLDLFVGKSVYYTGSPGEVIGDFVVAYTDSLGNEVPIELSECTQIGYQGPDVGAIHPGRGTPEYCTINNTELGISYTALLHTFSTPLDDNRLGYGLFIYDGDCTDLRSRAGRGHPGTDECLLHGDSIFPTEAGGNGKIDFGPWYGYAEDRAWPGSENFEVAFCDSFGNTRNMTTFCEKELEDQYEAGLVCEWNEITDPNNRCYCGDIRDTPVGGAL